MKTKTLLGLVAAAGLLPFANVTSAQYLEEIIVTSRKRVETVQDTPVAVRAISAQTLQRFDLTNLEEIAAMSPEFTVGRASNGSGAQLTIRGIGSSFTSIGVEQSVAVIVDDAYYGQGRTINEGMFDLERVELLKGPQALFFGKNATAGVISMTTAGPTEEFEMTGRFSAELEGDKKIAEFIVSGPINDVVGARLALRGSWGGEYFKNRARPVTYTTVDAVDPNIIREYTATPAKRNQPGGEEFMGRFTLAADPTDQLSMTLKLSGTRSKDHDPSWNMTTFNSMTGFSTLNPDNPTGNKFVVFHNNLPNFDGRFPLAGNGKLGNDYRSGQVTGNIEYDFGDFTLTSITNYQYNKNEFVCACDHQSSDTGTWATEETTWKAFSEELRLLTNFDSAVNVMLGLLYQKTEREFEQYIAFAGAENSAAGPYRYVAIAKDSFTDGKTISPFFQLIWNVTDTVEVNVGARYTREEKKSAFVQPYINPLLLGTFREDELVAADQKFTDWTPELTVNWAITDDVMIYGAYKTGYKSGGFSNSGLFSALGSREDFIFEPETAKGFEAGIKSTILDRQLRLNATLYSYEYEDLQVDFFNAPVFAFTTLNAGSAETRGIEIDAEYVPSFLPDLTLRAALNYNKAKYQDFIAPCWSGQTIAEGCNLVVPGTVATPGQDISGAPTAMAPEWTSTLSVDYQRSFAGGLQAGFSTSVQYIDDYNSSSFDNPHARRDSYTKLDASIFVASASDRWRLSLIGKNLTNKHIVTTVVDGPSTGEGTGTVSGKPADQVGGTALPRTVALQITGRL